MRPKRDVISKYQSKQKENDVQSVSLQTKTFTEVNQKTIPLRRALADKTNSVPDDNIRSVCKIDETKKQIMEHSERPKRHAKLPARLSDKSMEVPEWYRNVGKPPSTSTPLKLQTKVIKPDEKLPKKTADSSHNKRKAADTNINPDIISKQTKKLEKKSALSSAMENKQEKSITPVSTSIRKMVPIIGNKCLVQETINTQLKQVDILDNVDVYEFDFDPSEEPVVKKKKKAVRRRKKIVRDKPASAFFVKENYNKKIDKKLEELKKIIASKTSSKVTVAQSTIPDPPPVKKPESQTKTPVVHSHDHNEDRLLTENAQSRPHSPDLMEDFHFEDNNVPCAAESTAASVSEHDRTKTGNQKILKSTNAIPYANPIVTISNTSNRSDLSFSGEMPVACSSFNVSQVKKRPSGSPWRANFEVEPKRWPVNVYLKPGSLTPAYESTFHSVDLISNERRVYASLPKPTIHANQTSPRTPEKEYSQLKQSSILSFYEEVVTKSASKKAKKSKLTPQKFDLYYDASESSNKDLVTKRKAVAKSMFTTPTKLSMSSDSTPLKRGLDNLQDRTALSEILSPSNSPNKTPTTPSPKKNIETSAQKRKQELKHNFFGFDDSDEENDQENVSPHANINRQRGGAANITKRKREALKEVNKQRGPMRVDVPLKPKLLLPENIPAKIVDLMSQLDVVKAKKKPSKPIEFNESSSDSSEEILVKEPEVQPSIEELPLFTDIDFVHYNKPERRSYGKPKAATAKRVRSTCSEHEHAGSDLDISADFTVSETKRKPTKKRKVNTFSKKEEKEADEWAAGFNSMVEEVDEFALVVE